MLPKSCVLSANFNLSGKPIAVTHSKGKGAKLQPGANRQLEKALWEQGRSKRGKANSRIPLPEQSFEGEGAVPAHTAAANADVVAILTSNAASDSSEEFYSMAEIASCSYEARQVIPPFYFIICALRTEWIRKHCSLSCCVMTNFLVSILKKKKKTSPDVFLTVDKRALLV